MAIAVATGILLQVIYVSSWWSFLIWIQLYVVNIYSKLISLLRDSSPFIMPSLLFSGEMILLVLLVCQSDQNLYLLPLLKFLNPILQCDFYFHFRIPRLHHCWLQFLPQEIVNYFELLEFFRCCCFRLFLSCYWC